MLNEMKYNICLESFIEKTKLVIDDKIYKENYVFDGYEKHIRIKNLLNALKCESVSTNELIEIENQIKSSLLDLYVSKELSEHLLLFTYIFKYYNLKSDRGISTSIGKYIKHQDVIHLTTLKLDERPSMLKDYDSVFRDKSRGNYLCFKSDGKYILNASNKVYYIDESRFYNLFYLNNSSYFNPYSKFNIVNKYMFAISFSSKGSIYFKKCNSILNALITDEVNLDYEIGLFLNNPNNGRNAVSYANKLVELGLLNFNCKLDLDVAV